MTKQLVRSNRISFLRFSTLVGLLLMANATAALDPPEIQWTTPINPAGSLYYGAARQTVQGDYIIAGRTSSSLPYLARLDASGATLWTQVHPFKTSNEIGTYLDVDQTPDGGFLASGYHYKGLDRSALITRADGNGTVVWQKIFGTKKASDTGFYCRALTDGGVLLAMNEDNSGSHPHLLRLSPTGSVVWEKVYGVAYMEDGGLELTADGGALLAVRNLGVMRMNSGGVLVWQVVVSGGGQGLDNHATELTDGGLVVTGQTNNTATRAVEVTRTNAAGAIVWQTTYGTGSGRMTAPCSDGGFLLTASILPGNGALVARLDPAGTVQWQTVLGNYHARSLQETVDQGALVVYTLSDGQTVAAKVAP